MNLNETATVIALVESMIESSDMMDTEHDKQLIIFMAKLIKDELLG